jgi:hypothetical protein
MPRLLRRAMFRYAGRRHASRRHAGFRRHTFDAFDFHGFSRQRHDTILDSFQQAVAATYSATYYDYSLDVYFGLCRCRISPDADAAISQMMFPRRYACRRHYRRRRLPRRDCFR